MCIRDSGVAERHPQQVVRHAGEADGIAVRGEQGDREQRHVGDAVLVATGDEREQAPEDDAEPCGCLLYTSDAADDRYSVDLGGRRIIKKKKQNQQKKKR